MTTRYVITDSRGRFVTYFLGGGRGPSLTNNAAWRYQWKTAVEAEGQRAAYENALGVPLKVEEYTTDAGGLRIK